jgi:glutamine amidotransferase
LWRYIHKLAEDISKLGVFSFLMSDSYYLYVYCTNNMCWITRKHPFGKARLIDTGEIVDFRKLTTPKDIVTIVTSRALTDNEEWHHMKKGEFVVFKDGVQQKFRLN